MRSQTRWLWTVIPAMLAALALVAFDSVVLFKHADAPGLMAGWCLYVLGLLGLAGRLAKRPGTGDHPWAAPWRRIDAGQLTVVALLLVLFAAFHVSFERAASDGRELFVQVRSLVMDRDFDFANENAALGVRGTAGMYPPGTALLWAPFHLACHLWLGALNLAGAEHVRDGFTNPYQRAMGLGTFVYGAVALMLIYGLLRRYFSRSTSLLAWAALVFGSFVAWYIAVESSMSHGVSLFAVTVFVLLWHAWRDRRTPANQMVLGILAGLMTLVRWENVLFLAVPAVGWLTDLVEMARGRSRQPLADVARQGVALALGMALALLVLVPYWGALPQGALAGVSQYHRVGERGLHIVDVLFSPDHGLFSWTPVIYLSVLGMLLFLRRDRVLGWGLVLSVLALVLTNASVAGWDGGSGFGARRFTVAALPFALGLAALVDEARRRPLVPVTAVLAALVMTNVFLMSDVRQGKLETASGIAWDEMLHSTYWRTGNPFSFPGSLFFSLQHGTPLRLYDQLGVRSYNNLAIDLGADDDERFLLDGWSGREEDGVQTFRWAITTRSRVMVPLRGLAYVIRIRMAPFAFPGAPPQVLQVKVNDRTVDRLEMLPGMRDYDVPFVLARKGRATSVELLPAWAQSPRAADGADDPRLLSVQVDYIRFIRQDTPRR